MLNLKPGKKELNQKAKLSIYQSILTFTHGHKLWVVTERKRSWIQSAELRLLCRLSGLTLRDKELLRLELQLLHIERIQFR